MSILQHQLRVCRAEVGVLYRKIIALRLSGTVQMNSTREIFIMGRDPVELAKRAKYKPPAMRVRGVCYTKKSPFRYNEVVQAKQIAKGR